MRRHLWLMLWLTAEICTAAEAVPGFHISSSSVSRKNLVSGSMVRDGSRLVRLEHPSGFEVDVIRVLAVRVEFQTDADDMTNGDGHFMMESPAEPVLNAPPHDRTYFQNQLLALSNYYEQVSGGMLKIEAAVCPEIITLPHEMGYYNPGTTEARTDQGLAELMRDAVETADSLSVSFSGYNALIIFHAGVGRDIELGYDPTPRDIPSAFLNADDLSAALGSGYAGGIPVKNAGPITEAVILPETQNQEGYELGLLGTMTLMFGFQLGLPALWDTLNGRSGAGSWAMMDQGSGNYFGMIPCEPCAFSKVFLGWETPIEVRNGTGLVIACSAASDPRKIYKVPINDHEYYLLENRRYDADFDSVTYGTDVSGRRILFPSTGYLDLDEPIDVIVSVDEYDYGIPGSGILIWHVDESLIAERLTSNRINPVNAVKALDLEEADGAQDIGESYGFLSGGSGAESGVWHDAWFGDNNIHMLANHSETVAFTPQTYPNTRSNSGGNSHISINDFSVSDTVMTFSLTTDLFQQGFPVMFPEGLTPYAPVVIDLDGDDLKDILVATVEGSVFAWHGDGSPFFPSAETGYHASQVQDMVLFPLPLFVNIHDSIPCAPAVGDWDNDGLAEVFIASTDRLIVFTPADSDGDSQADSVNHFRWQNERPTALSLNIATGEAAIGFRSGKAYGWNGGDGFTWMIDEWGSGPVMGLAVYPISGQPSGWLLTQGNQFSLESPAGGVSSYNLPLGAQGPIVISRIKEISMLWGASPGGWYNVNLEPFEIHDSGPIHEPGGGLVFPALGDLDGDGFVDGTLTANGQVFAFQGNASLKNGFPQPAYERDVDLSSPVLGDINNDGLPEIITHSSSGIVEVWSADGSTLDEFPLAAGGNQAVTPVITDLDGDGDIEIVALSNYGWLYAWDFEGRYDSDAVPWPQEACDPARSGLYSARLTPEAPDEENWMPKNLAYNYPNPNEDNFTIIRYRLERSAGVTIKIYDMAGEKVYETRGPGLTQADNEVRWDLSDIVSGVYLCHIKAVSEDGTKEVTFKIGVIK